MTNHSRAEELERLLSELQDETVKALLHRVKTNDLEMKDFAVVIKFLKDNNMTLEYALMAAPTEKGPKLSVPYNTDEAKAL